jgi:hypothetical protein
MPSILKNIGNIKQFGKEEMYNGLNVIGIGYFGACVMLLIKYRDILLPYDTNKLPYSDISPEILNNMGTFKYFFSYESNFPHKIVKTQFKWIDMYTKFFGTIIMNLFSSYRYMIHSLFSSLDTENKFVRILSFYILPTIISYIISLPIIPIIASFINLKSCIFDKTIEPLILTFAFIVHWFDPTRINMLMDFTQLPFSAILWILYGIYGAIISFCVLPMVSITSCISVWIYIITLWFLLPLYLKFLANISFDELKTKLSNEIQNNIFGLVSLFLLYTITSAYKNLNSQAALGITIGSIGIIYSLLKIHVFMPDIGFLQNIFSMLSGVKIVLFWVIIIFIVIYKYRSTQSSLLSSII